MDVILASLVLVINPIYVRTDPAKKNHPFVKVILLALKINLIYAQIELVQVRN